MIVWTNCSQISDQCGGGIIGYEILYYQLKSSPNNETVFFAPDSPSDSQTRMSYTVHHLEPYTEYSVQVRTVIQVSGGSQQFVSNFSQPRVFMTPEGGMC